MNLSTEKTVIIKSNNTTKDEDIYLEAYLLLLLKLNGNKSKVYTLLINMIKIESRVVGFQKNH